MNGILQPIAAHQDTRTHTYITQGDWNTSPLSYNSNTLMFNEFIDTHQLHIMHNHLPTYVRGTRKTIIDHFLISPSLLHFCTTASVLVSDESVTSPASDHRAISIHLSNETSNAIPLLNIYDNEHRVNSSNSCNKINLKNFRDDGKVKQSVPS